MEPSVYNFLMDCADTPVRYRVAREFLLDTKTAKKLERELLETPAARLWLQNLKPQTPPQHRWMEHGSFDFCLENALLKLVQLGLHGGMPQVRDAVGFYLARLETAAGYPQKRQDFITAVLTANLLSLAQVEHEAVQRYMLASLHEMHAFMQRKPLALYLSEEEKQALAGVPKCWKDKPFLRPEIIREYGYAFPMLYDIAGMHSLYRLGDSTVNHRIGDIIRRIFTDTFHRSVADGYGITIMSKGSYMAMGWDPKAPGWFDVADYLAQGRVPQLLFYALHASRYPAARETQWFSDLLAHLDLYQTADGRYAFPAAWLPETQGYAVMGRHLSFGENRRKKNWREIESTFYRLLLNAEPGLR